MKQQLNIITLGVKNLKRSLDFYERGLEWRRSKASQGDIVFFQLNGLVLALYPKHLLAEDANISPEGNGFSGITLAYNTTSEDEVECVIKKVQKLGAKIVKQPQKAFWGGFSGYFKDPDGHLFEVAYNPFLILMNVMYYCFRNLIKWCRQTTLD